MREKTYRHDTKDTIASRAERIPRPPLRRRKQLRRIPVEHRIHDVAEETKRAVPPQQGIARRRRRGAVQEDARQDGTQRQRPLAPHARQLDQPSSQNGTRNTKDRNDETVAVCDVRAAVALVGSSGREDVRDKGIVQRIRQSDKCPHAHDESGAETKHLGRKQRPDIAHVEIRKRSLQRRRSVERRRDIAHRLARLEILDRDSRLFAILLRNGLNDTDGLLVTALAHEILWRLVDLEEGKSDDEHEQRQAAHGEDEISPSHILALRTRLILLTREISQQRPRNQRRNNLRNRPIDRKNCK